MKRTARAVALALLLLTLGTACGGGSTATDDIGASPDAAVRRDITGAWTPPDAPGAPDAPAALDVPSELPAPPPDVPAPPPDVTSPSDTPPPVDLAPGDVPGPAEDVPAPLDVEWPSDAPADVTRPPDDVPGALDAPAPPADVPPDVEAPLPPAVYVVLCGAPAGDPWCEAAEPLATAHGAEVLHFDPANPAGVLGALQARAARYVAVVVPSEAMDANLVRRVLLLSTRLDADPFCDFAFGFVTGASPAEARAFAARAVDPTPAAAPGRFVRAGVVAGLSATGALTDGLATALGLDGVALSFGHVETDPATRAFVDAHLAELSGSAAVELTGPGDPESIWLFDPERNYDLGEHWLYDPALVGQDPDGEMPRISASDLAGLDLTGATVWSGVSHNAVVARTFVEDEIVSTFGTVMVSTEHVVPPARSAALALLASGARAYAGTMAASHEARATLERTYAMEAGATLGDAMRRGYHDMVMACRGSMSCGFGFFEAGAALGSHAPDPRFWSGPEDRVLFGDPAYAPFPEGGPSAYEVTVTRRAGDAGRHVSVRIAAEWASVYARHALAGPGEGDGRVYVTVRLPSTFESYRIESLLLRSPSGFAASIGSTTTLEEQLDGRRYLHLQVTSASSAVEEVGAILTFDIVPD